VASGFQCCVLFLSLPCVQPAGGKAVLSSLSFDSFDKVVCHYCGVSPFAEGFVFISLGTNVCFACCVIYIFLQREREKEQCVRSTVFSWKCKVAVVRLFYYLNWIYVNIRVQMTSLFGFLFLLYYKDVYFIFVMFS
jgi:hypothetical protein